MYDALLANLAILVLAGFVGFAVISKVPNTLHTPLMSGTNAIHGIVRARRAGGVRARSSTRRWRCRSSCSSRWCSARSTSSAGSSSPTGCWACSRARSPLPAKASGRDERAAAMNYLVIVLYIIAFALFIYGLMGLTGPKTAVRGNRIAAVGHGDRGGGDADQDPAHRATGC